jgi:antitoxin HicB
MAEDRSVNASLDFYLAQPYPYTVLPDAEDGGFVIVFPDLPGCLSQAESADEIAPMADEARRLWIETEYERGHDIPLPTGVGGYSGKFVVRLPKSLHRSLAESAEREGVSLNAWVTTLLAGGAAARAIDERLARMDHHLGEIAAHVRYRTTVRERTPHLRVVSAETVAA